MTMQADIAIGARDNGPGPKDRRAIDTIRTLSMDAVQKAASGHPGTPMALAPVGWTIWSRFLRYDPAHPDWPNRDRFILSVGHASMLLYSLIHLAGIAELGADGKKTGREAVSLDDIKQFRQMSSRTPGHPEYRHTTGVETTTGPLGQGCGNSVGMAIAERWLAARYNKPGFPVFDHDVYVVCGDGDLMEGVTAEVASLAGHLKLSNLCWIYDSNSISIEGSTDLAFSENVRQRFEAYGWSVLDVDDANDVTALTAAINQFKATNDRPTLVIVQSVIGWGSPRAGSAKAHGEPLGLDNIRATKVAYGWPVDDEFHIPDGVTAAFREKLAMRGARLRDEWLNLTSGYADAFPELGAELAMLLIGVLPTDWSADIPEFAPAEKGQASRDASGAVLNAIAGRVPWLIGGSADLSPSTKTDIKGEASFGSSDYSGRNLHFGVREHGMGAVVNGMALSYLKSYGSTFLVFADYMRPAIRMAAIMRLGTVWVFTHDSIGVGEDGPTHQPIEHLASLRAIPGLDTIRPCDANETAWAWRAAMENKDTTTALVLSRQALPTLDRAVYAPADGLMKGAYVLSTAADPELILIASGSEVSLAVSAFEQLTADGVRARIVSMPSWHRFELQSAAYKEYVFPAAVHARVAIEMASAMGWDRYVGAGGQTVTISTFGESAPAATLQNKYGFTVDNIVTVARHVMGHR